MTNLDKPELLTSALSYGAKRGYEIWIEMYETEAKSKILLTHRKLTVDMVAGIMAIFETDHQDTVYLRTEWRPSTGSGPWAYLVTNWSRFGGRLARGEIEHFNVPQPLRTNSMVSDGPAVSHLLLDVVMTIISRSQLPNKDLPTIVVHVSPTDIPFSASMEQKKTIRDKIVQVYEAFGVALKYNTSTGAEMQLKFSDYRTHFDMLRAKVLPVSSGHPPLQDSHFHHVEVLHEHGGQVEHIYNVPRLPPSKPVSAGRFAHIVRDGNHWRMV